MHSVFEVLQNKEAQLQVLEKEIAALRVAAKIITESEGGGAAAPVPASPAANGGAAKKRWP